MQRKTDFFKGFPSLPGSAIRFPAGSGSASFSQVHQEELPMLSRETDGGMVE